MKASVRITVVTVEIQNWYLQNMNLEHENLVQYNVSKVDISVMKLSGAENISEFRYAIGYHTIFMLNHVCTM